MAMSVAKLWTRAEVLALPEDGRRHELVDGELLVSPSPRPLHQYAVLQFAELVGRYVRHHRVGDLLASPADLDLQCGQLVQPDLFVLSRPEGRRLQEWTEAGIPLLVIEVLSPSTARADRLTKRRLYQRSGVPVYWIVDAEARRVEVWTGRAEAARMVDRILTWQPRVDLPPLEIDLPACFSAIAGE